MTPVGPLGRLGRWTAGHGRVVALAWLVLALPLGILAPRVEHALSGAGWEASGSESVETRRLVEREFGGLSSSALTVVLHSDRSTVADAAFGRAIDRVETILRSHSDVAAVVRPEVGTSISRDGRTALVLAGAAGSPTEMVHAADELADDLAAAAGEDVEVALTGASGMWADFNTANREAMLKSELISWPVTLAILVVAFGSLVAAGLPLLLTVLGLVAAAGSLFLASQVADVSIWAMNFALMFALALGIDYALFIVHRFRGAFFGSKLSAAEAVAVAMDTAGKAVLFSGLTVLVSLSAVLLVPSPAFRSMALGIMLSVVFVLAATLTLLPAVLAKLGPRVDRLALPWVHAGEHRSPAFARWAERLWRRPVAWGAAAAALLVVLALPALGLETGMPSIKVVPEGDSSRRGYDLVQEAFGLGAPGALQVVVPRERSDRRRPGPARRRRSRGRRRRRRVGDAHAAPGDAPRRPVRPRRRRDDRPPARRAPPGSLVGGAAAENHDLEEALSSRTPLVVGVVLVLGFLLLLLALQAPLIAAVGVLTNLLATAAAFGVGAPRLPGRGRCRTARLRVAGLRRRLGTRVLLRDDLRDLDGLHRLPALLREGALGPDRGRAGRNGRRRRALGARDLRRGGGDGGDLLHLRPLRATAAEGDGRDPRRRGPARRGADPARPAAGVAAAARPRSLGAPALARLAPGRPLRPFVTSLGRWLT